ncbi:MAG: hypothetical protein KC435_00730 [Thermomicrobiales bacterium]|nr:hypothetical protein [Thermomicrobiales bacterium]
MTSIKARLTSVASIVVLLSLLFTSIPLKSSVSAQGVGWLGDDSVSYLTSSGITVMVPSWVPGPVNGVAPEISAGGGSYGIYFYYSGTTFLYITGVAGAGFPGGSEANLNVQLSVNASVQGYSAIQDIGIPEGSSTPIYDKVMWIQNGVLYTIMGNGLDTDSLTLANSSVALYAPVAPAPTDVPVVTQPEEASSSSSSTSSSSGSDTGGTSQTSTTSQTSGSSVVQPTPTPTLLSDGTDGAVYPSPTEPTDGTNGPIPPVTANDGTGGAWLSPSDFFLESGAIARRVVEHSFAA